MRETLMTDGGPLPRLPQATRRALLLARPSTPIRLDMLPTHTLTALYRLTNSFASVTPTRWASRMALAPIRTVLRDHRPALLCIPHSMRKIKRTDTLDSPPSHESIRTTPLNPPFTPWAPMALRPMRAHLSIMR